MNSKSINIFDVYVLCLVLKCTHARTHTHTYISLFFFQPLYPIYGGINASFVMPLGSFNVGFDGSPNDFLADS